MAPYGRVNTATNCVTVDISQKNAKSADNLLNPQLLVTLVLLN